MLRKKAIRKILVTTFSCFTLMILYIMPTKFNDDFLNPNVDVIYTSAIYNSEIYLMGDNNYLVKANIMLKSENIKDKVIEAIEYLKIDSKYSKPIGLKGIIPKDTNINNIEIIDNKVKIDFNNKLLNVDFKLEERLIESIIYSLTSIEGIDEIEIMIDGKKINSLPNSKKILPEILSRDFGINKIYDITNRNGIQKVILYYTENISNNNYYVPVTKYINDDRDKIKIIIDSLSSSYIYEENLGSFLRNDVSLLDYDLSESKMEVNFNKDIFPNDKLLESVEYTLSYSIFDNYQVDKILLKVNGVDVKEINKCDFTYSCVNE